MNDPIFFYGGLAFIVLAFLSIFDRDRLWQLYTIDRWWRNHNPERGPAWDEKTKKLARVYLVIGIIAIIAGI